MNKYINLFYTSKPYSYSGQISLGILFAVIVKPTISVFEIFGISFISLIMWLYFNWQSDWIQKDEGKARTPFYFLILLLAVCFAITYIFLNNLRFYWIFAYALPIVLYSFKGKSAQLAPWGFVFRFLSVFGFYLMILGLIGEKHDLKNLTVPILFGLFKATRNLIGDVRDVKKDKFEFPVKFGYQKTNLALRILFLLTVLVEVIYIDSNIYLFWLLFSWLGFEILNIKFKKKDYNYTGYFTHRFLVLTISLLTINDIYLRTNDEILSIILILVLLMFQFTYIKLPGKNYPNLKELFN